MAELKATPRRPFGFGRVQVRELLPPAGDTARPPTHKPHTPTALYGDRPGQRKQRGRQPLPPRRERPPDLVALERGELLYGGREERAAAHARLLEGDTRVTLEATFAIGSVIVQNTSAASTVLVAGGNVEPALGNALAIVPPRRIVSVPVGAERTLSIGAGAALAAGELVIVTATDAMLAAGGGSL